MSTTRNAAPAPRPSNEEMLDAIGKMPLIQFLRLRYFMNQLLLRKVDEQKR